MSSELYQVEEILGRKSESGQVFYRIKWSGYSSQYNTWEPEENLANCRDLIEEFMEKDTSKERKRTLRSSPARSKRALAAAATVALSSDDEGALPTKTPQKKQQRTRKSPGRPAKSTKQQQQQPASAPSVTSTLPAGLFGRDYKLRPRENKLLAVSSDEESSPAPSRKAANTSTQATKADTRMSMTESNFRKRISDVNKGASTSKKTTSTPQSKSSTASAQQGSPQIKTKLRFDSSKRRSGRNKEPLISIEQVTEGEENKNADPNLSVIAEADEDPAEAAKEPSPADTSGEGGYPGWPPVGWKEFAIAAFVTAVAAVGYVCYTTDYCKYC